LPSQLTALQQAQLSDLVSFIHDRIGSILHDAHTPGPADELQRSAEPGIEGGVESLIELTPELSAEGPGNQMLVAAETWQRLLGLEMELAVYLRSIAEPSESPGSNG